MLYPTQCQRFSHVNKVDRDATSRFHTYTTGLNGAEQMLNTLNFLAIAFAFFGSWIYAMRWLAGWARLQTLYAIKPDALTEQISNGSFRWVGCRLRWTSIAVAIELYPKGLFLRPYFPLNMALHAVCIPWPAIDAHNRQTLLGRKTTLQIDGYPWPIHILGHPGLVIKEHLQGY